jgi:hypothetical protein
MCLDKFLSIIQRQWQHYEISDRPMQSSSRSKRKWDVYEILTQKIWGMVGLTLEFNKLNMV